MVKPKLLWRDDFTERSLKERLKRKAVIIQRGEERHHVKEKVKAKAKTKTVECPRCGHRFEVEV